MREMRDIVARYRLAGERGERVVLATLVDCDGSTYRRPGAQALFVDTGEVVGLLSGGCLEVDLGEHARRLAANQRSLLTYDLRGDDEVELGLGLGCKGVLTILLERIQPGDSTSPLERLARRLGPGGGERTGAVALVFDDEATGARIWYEHQRFDRDDAAPSGPNQRELEAECVRVAASGRPRVRRDLRALVAPLPRRSSLLLLGAGPDARPIVELAKAVGFRVAVWDHREAATARLDPCGCDELRVVALDALSSELARTDASAVLVMTHNQRVDRMILRALARRTFEYVGVLGPRDRTAALRSEIAEDGASIPTLVGPVGLDIGGEAPEAIALSIVAEIHAALHGRKGGRLSDRSGPIHDRAA